MLIDSVVSVPGVRQSDSEIHTYILFHIHFHNGLFQDVKYNSLCYIVEHFVVYFTYSSLYLLIPTPNSPLPTPSPLLIINLCSVSVSLLLFCK